MSEFDKKEFEIWHEQILIDRQYPQEIVIELRRTRIKWLNSIKIKKVEV